MYIVNMWFILFFTMYLRLMIKYRIFILNLRFKHKVIVFKLQFDVSRFNLTIDDRFRSFASMYF